MDTVLDPDRARGKRPRAGEPNLVTEAQWGSNLGTCLIASRAANLFAASTEPNRVRVRLRSHSGGTRRPAGDSGEAGHRTAERGRINLSEWTGALLGRRDPFLVC